MVTNGFRWNRHLKMPMSWVMTASRSGAAVPSTRLHSMVDICAPFVQGEPITSYFNKLGDRLRHVHIVDSDGASDSHYIPGEGKIPLAPLMRELAQRQYHGFCTIELVTMYMNEPRLHAALALDRFKALLAA